MAGQRSNSLTKTLTAMAGLGSAYWLASVAGLYWAAYGGAGSPVWPAAGIGIAGLLVGGLRLWPAIFLGRLAAGLTVGSDHALGFELWIAGANSLAVAMPVAALGRLSRLDLRLASLRDVLGLALVCGASALIAAGLGTMALRLSLGFDWQMTSHVAINWFFGNFVGGLVVAALILSWSERVGRPRPPTYWLHLSALVLITTGAGALIFSGEGQTHLRTWFVFPVLIWAALGFRVQGASLSLFIIAAFTVWGATFNLGAFSVFDIDLGRVGLAQQFLLVISLTTLFLAAAADERRSKEALADTARLLRQSEERLRESEARREAALTAARLGTFDWDLRTQAVVLDERSREIFGFSPDEGGHAEELFSRIHPADLARTLAETGDAKRKRGRLETEYQIMLPGGEVRYISSVSDAVIGSHGSAERMIGVFVDITARKEAEEALRESEARLRALTDNLPVAMVYQLSTSADLKRRSFVYVSANCEQITGVPAGRILADPTALMAQLHSNDAETFFAAERRAADEMSLLEAEVRGRRPDGRSVIFHVYARPRRTEKGLLWDGLLLDVTARREAEEALRVQAQELRTVLDAVPAGIWLTRDPAALTITGNLRSYEFLRVPVGQNQSKSTSGSPTDHFRFLGPDGRVLPPEELPVQQAASGKEVKDYEYRVDFDDGSHIDLFGNAIPLRDAAGRVVGAVAAFVDISERKRFEEHQRLLVNELNHRVKNTLATVQSIVSQTMRSATSPAEAGKALEGRLIALARAHDVLTRESWASADLVELLSEALAPFVEFGEGRVTLDGPPVRLPPRMALALAMAVQELATNATKYGAFRDAAGRVDVIWKFDRSNARLHLEWRETGGPIVEVPKRRGFGSRMIERALAQELQGEVRLEFKPEGVVCIVEACLV